MPKPMPSGGDGFRRSLSLQVGGASGHQQSEGQSTRHQAVRHDDGNFGQNASRTVSVRPPAVVIHGGKAIAGRADDGDMPPHPTKLGEAFPSAIRRPVSARGDTNRNFATAAKQGPASARYVSHVGVVGGDAGDGAGRRGGRNSDYGSTTAAHKLRSPSNAGAEGPVQFHKMPKPVGWQAQQAVEIRRDWITFLAKGLGIDTKLYTGPDLESQLARKMLEQAESNFFEDTSEELDTEEEEEENKDYWEAENATRRNRPAANHRRQPSRTRSRGRQPGLGGVSSRDEHGRPRRARQGGVLRRVLQRAQTTGDVGGGQRRSGDGRVRRGDSRYEDEPKAHKRKGVLADAVLREGSTESRESLSRPGVSRRGVVGRIVTGGKHRRNRSRGSTSSCGSSASRSSAGKAVPGRISQDRLDQWRDKFSAESGVHRGGANSGGTGVEGSGVAVTSGGLRARGGWNLPPNETLVDVLGHSSGSGQTQTSTQGRSSPDPSLSSSVEHSSPPDLDRGGGKKSARGAVTSYGRVVGSGRHLPSELRAVGEEHESSSGSAHEGVVGPRGSREGGSGRISREGDREHGKERGNSRDRRHSRERELSRERGYSRSRGHPLERDVSRDRRESRERGHSRDRNQSRGRGLSGERREPRDRWRSRERGVSRDREESRQRGVSRNRRESRERGHSHERGNWRDGGQSQERGHSRERSISCDRRRSRERGHSRERGVSRDHKHAHEHGQSSDSRRSKQREPSRERGKSLERSRERSRDQPAEANTRRAPEGLSLSTSATDNLSRVHSRESMDSTTSSQRKSRYPEFPSSRGTPTPSFGGSLEAGSGHFNVVRPTPQRASHSRSSSKGPEDRSEGSFAGSGYSRDPLGAAGSATSGRAVGMSAGTADVLPKSRRERSSGSYEGTAETAAAAIAAAMAAAADSSDTQESRSRVRQSSVSRDACSKSLAGSDSRISPDSEIRGRRESKRATAIGTLGTVSDATTIRKRDNDPAQSKRLAGNAVGRHEQSKSIEHHHSAMMTDSRHSTTGAGGSRTGNSDIDAQKPSRVDVGATIAAGDRKKISVADMARRFDIRTSSPDAGAGPRTTASTSAASLTPTESAASSVRSTTGSTRTSVARRWLPGSAERRERRAHAESPAAGSEEGSSRGLRGGTLSLQRKNGGSESSEQALSATSRGSSSQKNLPAEPKVPMSSKPWVTAVSSRRNGSVVDSSNAEFSARQQGVRQESEEEEDRELAAAAAAVVSAAVASGRAARFTDTEGTAPMDVEQELDTSDKTAAAPKHTRRATVPGVDPQTALSATSSQKSTRVRNSQGKRSLGSLDMTATQTIPAAATSVKPHQSEASTSRSKAERDSGVGGASDRQGARKSRRERPSTSSPAGSPSIPEDGSFYDDLYDDGRADMRADRAWSSPIGAGTSMRGRTTENAAQGIAAGKNRTGTGIGPTVVSAGIGGSAGGPRAREGMPPREGSRERVKARLGARAEGGVGSAEAVGGTRERTKSVVQSTGAAAAAAAAADDGGYGQDWDKLEMHRAVYANDLPRLRLFIADRPQGLKQADHHSNTPLLLALKLERTEMAWVMIRAGSDLDIPSDGSFHLLDEAIVLGDEDLLVEVYGRLQRQSWARWREKVPHLLDLLDDNIPDFYMEMHWSFECSNVLAPIVKAVAPHDQYRIWKKGSWLRMDSTITGYTKRLKTQRGNVSLIFLGKDSPAPGTLIKLDHGKKKIYNVLRRLESPTPSEVRRTCRRYLSAGHSKRPANQVDAFVIKSSDLDFKPVKDHHGRTKKATVGPWACDVHECTGDMQLQTFRKGPGDNLLIGISMKDYFDSKRTLADKVLEAAGVAGSASPSTSLFSFGDKHKENQKAKILAKFNTPHKRYEKKIKASMCMSQDFPLTLEHVTPMLEVLSMQDKVIQKLKEVLTTKGMREAGFPAKVSLPLYLGVFAVVTFDNCRVYKRGELEPELFLVNPEYGSSRRMRKGVYEGVMPGNVRVPRAEDRGDDATAEGKKTPYPPANALVAGRFPYKVWQPSDGRESPPTASTSHAPRGAGSSTKRSSQKEGSRGGGAGTKQTPSPSAAGRARSHQSSPATQRSQSIRHVFGRGGGRSADTGKAGMNGKEGRIAMDTSGAWIKGRKSQSSRNVYLDSQTWHGGVGGAGPALPKSDEVGTFSDCEEDSVEGDDDDDDEASSDEEDDVVMQRR